MYRSHTCNELRKSDAGSTVKLSGWVQKRRDLGDCIFLDLRDRYGITQIMFDKKVSPEAHAAAEDLRAEWVIMIDGDVKARMEGQENKHHDSGDIEIMAEKVTVLSKSEPLPWDIHSDQEVGEETRYKYRYLDLRRPHMFHKIQFRSKMNHFSRNWFVDQGFLEVQTPIFTVSSPEGARDYLIPSRIHPGKFYALPQAPQQYKQILMVAGIDKYFQIAPCFRDEDPRADRHSCEFYQLDCEMSFVDEAEVFSVVEGYLKDLIPAMVPEKTITKNSFIQLTHKESMDQYGSDKPDLRFGMKFEDFSEIFQKSECGIFSGALKNGGIIKGMKLSQNILSRKDIDALTEEAKKVGAKGLAYLIFEESEIRGSVRKFLSDDELQSVKETLRVETGDMVFFTADAFDIAVKSMSAVRLACRDTFNLASKTDIAFTWVTDFPIFTEEDGKLDFEHNPFSLPKGDWKNIENPLDIVGHQYDLSCNGYEILSGSIRNHNPESLVELFAFIGKDEQEVKDKFGGLYKALTYGAPPHGGFAFGFDRLLMILLDEENIRDIYAFPKSGKAQDLMMEAPSAVDTPQLDDLHIQLKSN